MRTFVTGREYGEVWQWTGWCNDLPAGFRLEMFVEDEYGDEVLAERVGDGVEPYTTLTVLDGSGRVPKVRVVDARPRPAVEPTVRVRLEQKDDDSLLPSVVVECLSDHVVVDVKGEGHVVHFGDEIVVPLVVD